ncbi:hypothetical protein CJ030_MR4G026703 [Morella rubra]|uniref:Uncharacterized protein n=1 Tax=Morella rubra TaxID=262757 RepID=A0A6A1VUA6_9ROSI|nr:hypothetical protein CJ030_MR4G026703 [Morella rubra]
MVPIKHPTTIPQPQPLNSIAQMIINYWKIYKMVSLMSLETENEFLKQSTKVITNQLQINDVKT